MKTRRAATAIQPACEVAVSGKGLGRGLRGRIAKAATAALRRERCRRAVVSIAVVDDATIADLHQRYLGLAGPTDVMSFDLRDRPVPARAGRASKVEGEVVVSIETARREARQRRIPMEQELLRYAIHGTLHLLGYRDDTAGRADAMHRIEDELLRDEERPDDETKRARPRGSTAARSRVGATG